MPFCPGYYGVATVRRIDIIIGLFSRLVSLLSGSFANKTYKFIDPTNRSHPMCNFARELNWFEVDLSARPASPFSLCNFYFYCSFNLCNVCKNNHYIRK